MVGCKNSVLKLSSNCINRLPQYCRLSFSTTRGDSISNDELFGQVYLLSVQIPSEINQLLSENHQASLFATKIGFVQGESYNDVTKRMQQLSTGCPFPYKLAGLYRCKTPQVIESYFHQVFKQKWKRGDIVLDEIRSKAKKVKKRRRYYCKESSRSFNWIC